MLVLAPVLAFIVPLVFFGLRLHREPFLTTNIYITTLIITSITWVGNRFIMICSRTRYPLFEENRKRLRFQSLLMIVYTLLATNLMGYILSDYCDFENSNYPNRALGDILFNSNSASFFCTLTVVAIYESIYFMHQLKLSVEEKELLKRESLMAQLNALKTQVNPHFLFNNLNTLCSIIPEDPDQAVAFVQQLSKVYRHILEVKDEKSIPLKEELEVLEAYTFLLKTRFGDNLHIEMQVDPAQMDDKIVPLSLQLLMENAIKHNIVSQDRPLTIIVKIVGGRLVVSNNLQKKNQIIESTGIGLTNIRNRYKLITDKLILVTETLNDFTVSIPLIQS